jgi:hypothetical protein
VQEAKTYMVAPANSTIEQPTMMFRWYLDGDVEPVTGRPLRTLEQMWQVLEHENASGKLVSMRNIWRPVPVVTSKEINDAP